jgi:hypothetical protein
MKVNNYPVKTPAAGDKLFGSDASGDQKQFDMTAVSSNVFQYEIGEYVADEGGVIFHRYLDGNTEKYIVVDTNNLSTSSAWSNVASTLIGSTAQSTWDGLSNSNAIVGQSGFTSGAAKLCLDSTNNSQTDWYLPSFDELNLFLINRFAINKGLSNVSGGVQIQTGYNYWSSTENVAVSAWGLTIQTAAYMNSFGKSATNYVRAIRQFSI